MSCVDNVLKLRKECVEVLGEAVVKFVAVVIGKTPSVSEGVEFGDRGSGVFESTGSQTLREIL